MKDQFAQQRALRHMRDAQAFGWHEKHLICDYAQAAMEMERFDADNAARIIEIVWARNFQTQPPI